MPHKNPEAAKASKRAYYLAHKELFLQRSKNRREKLQQESRALKAAAELLPKPIEPKECLLCGTDITSTYDSKHGQKCKECILEYHRAYRIKNFEKIAESKKKWKEANKEYVGTKDRAYALANPEKRTAARKKWVASNPGKNTAIKSLNKQSRNKRVPTWLSDDDKWLIEQTYELAALRTKMFGFSWHVDHIIPLQGKTVSGLHVPTNLQVIPGVENLRKNNRFEVGYAKSL